MAGDVIGGALTGAIAGGAVGVLYVVVMKLMASRSARTSHSQL